MVGTVLPCGSDHVCLCPAKRASISCIWLGCLVHLEWVCSSFFPSSLNEHFRENLTSFLQATKYGMFSWQWVRISGI